MKRFSFLALVAMVLCLVGCGPKETQTPLGATGEYVLYSKSDVPGKVGIKKANGVAVTPNVYSKIDYEQGLFIAQLDDKCLLLTPENKVSLQSSAPISYNKNLKCFETKEGNKSTFFFAKENGKVSGVFESYGLDENQNLLVKENGKYVILVIERNTVVLSKDPTAHAEVNAIRSACKLLNTKSLENCILVTTAKSCPMCLSAACWANIKTIYYSQSYDNAEESGFRDEKIAEYIKGNNEIIEEIPLSNPCCEMPFVEWNNKEDRDEY